MKKNQVNITSRWTAMFPFNGFNVQIDQSLHTKKTWCLKRSTHFIKLIIFLLFARKGLESSVMRAGVGLLKAFFPNLNFMSPINSL